MSTMNICSGVELSRTGIACRGAVSGYTAVYMSRRSWESPVDFVLAEPGFEDVARIVAERFKEFCRSHRCRDLRNRLWYALTHIPVRLRLESVVEGAEYSDVDEVALKTAEVVHEYLKKFGGKYAVFAVVGRDGVKIGAGFMLGYDTIYIPPIYVDDHVAVTMGVEGSAGYIARALERYLLSTLLSPEFRILEKAKTTNISVSVGGLVIDEPLLKKGYELEAQGRQLASELANLVGGMPGRETINRLAEWAGSVTDLLYDIYRKIAHAGHWPEGFTLYKYVDRLSDLFAEMKEEFEGTVVDVENLHYKVVDAGERLEGLLGRKIVSDTPPSFASIVSNAAALLRAALDELSSMRVVDAEGVPEVLKGKVFTFTNRPEALRWAKAYLSTLASIVDASRSGGYPLNEARLDAACMVITDSKIDIRLGDSPFYSARIDLVNGVLEYNCGIIEKYAVAKLLKECAGISDIEMLADGIRARFTPDPDTVERIVSVLPLVISMKERGDEIVGHLDSLVDQLKDDMLSGKSLDEALQRLRERVPEDVVNDLKMHILGKAREIQGQLASITSEDMHRHVEGVLSEEPELKQLVDELNKIVVSGTAVVA